MWKALTSRDSPILGIYLVRFIESIQRYGSVLELVEHPLATRCVLGSIPAGDALKVSLVWLFDLGPKQWVNRPAASGCSPILCNVEYEVHKSL